MVRGMPGDDIGESLVGSYFRHIEGCDVVVYNSFFRDRQGEVDVVALKRQPSRTVILCEVTTHIEGMLIVRKGLNQTEHVIRQKLDRLASFAAVTFPDDRHRFEWWSPRVSVGRLTDAMQAIEAEQQAAGRDTRFVINEDYTDRVRQLVEHARRNSSATGEPAYRMLQVLGRLRGGRLSL
jgi:hypothetical protein